LPTRRSPAKDPKLDGAICRPHGESSAPIEIRNVETGLVYRAASSATGNYTLAQLPVINSLAEQYGVSDAWHSSVPTQTNPNRAFSMIGTSKGMNNNAWYPYNDIYKGDTFLNVLQEKGKKSWGLYYHDIWHDKKCFTEYTFPALSNAGGHIATIDHFFLDAHLGRLKNFTYIEPKWGISTRPGNDYHPPTDVYAGERFLWDVYTALYSSPQWKEMLFIVTFDEHGGTYDHVAPTWDAIPPDDHIGDYKFGFNLYGARVPTLLISRFVKPGTVFRASSGTLDHTSFINTFLRWAGVDVNSNEFDLGKRMPEAPHFDDVLFPTPVNDAKLDVKVPASAAPPKSADIFDGVPFPAIRAITRDSKNEEEMKAAVAQYRADPAAFEATLAAEKGTPPR